MPERLEQRALLALTVFETDAAWRVSAADPGAGWSTAAFDDSTFVAASQIGTATVDGGTLKTIWAPAASADIWLRKTISLEGRPATALFDAFADDDMEVFVNGVRFVNDANSSPTTVTNVDVTSALGAGTNVLAVRVRDVGGFRGFAARLEIDTERPDAGDTLATAMDVGVVPGIHVGAVTLGSAADVDLYRVELLRPDSLRATAALDSSAGSLAIAILDAAGQTVATAAASAGSVVAEAASLPAGTYYVRVAGSVVAKAWYRVAVDAGSASTTRVIYVNDGSSSDDVYALATGDDANDGLGPDRPKASLQGVLAAYDLGPDDLVVVDTGRYGDYGTPSYGTVTITAEDEAATFAGSAAGAGTRFVHSGTALQLADADNIRLHRLQFTGSGGTGVFLDAVAADRVTSDVTITASVFSGPYTGILVTGGARHTISGNSFSVSGYGIRSYATTSAAITELLVAGNAFAMGPGGVAASVSSTASATVRDNAFSGGSLGVDAWYVASLTLEANTFSGIAAAAARATYGTTVARGNAFTASGTGLIVSAGGVVEGNTFTGNSVGIASESSWLAVRGNTFTDNATGFTGTAQIGGTDWSTGQANVFTGNAVGIHARTGSVIAFNRVSGGTTGIRIAQDAAATWWATGVAVHHNLVVGQTGRGLLIDRGDGITIVNNTIVPGAAGDAIRLQTESRNVTLRNNIVSVDAGTALHVATNSQLGFTSDYNNLYRTPGGTGTLVWFQKPFTDLFDWQVEADYDTRSIGFTAPDPTRDAPQFVDAAGGNYRLAPSSTSIDAGRPGDAFSLEPGVNGGRIDLGGYGDTALATESADRLIRIVYPEYYTDWPAAEGRPIQWGTFDAATADGVLAGSVAIELHKVGVGKVADIATVAAATGSYGWSPQASGIVPGVADRYRIVIRSVEHPTVADTSREAFSIPAVSGSYFIDDGSNAADEYTPAATGSNRNTGATAADPKASLLALLRSYDLGGGDTVFIDTGDYNHVRNVVISGETGVGDDEGARFTGPVDPAKVARIDRANTNSFATTIELNDGDFVTLERLTLTGGHKGLWVRNGSTNFTGRDLVVTNNASDGILIESGSVGTVVARLTATGNAGTGISIATPIASLSDSVASNNGQYGIYLSSTGATAVEANTVSGNRYGVYAYNPRWAGTGTTVIGHPDLALGRGNVISGNAEFGVLGYDAVTIVGNAVSAQTVGVGIRPLAGAVAERNLLSGNRIGIDTSTYWWWTYGGIVRNNRITGSTEWGIVSTGGDITGNVLAGNANGITVDGNFDDTIANNIVSGSASVGLRVAGTAPYRSADVLNNTFRQTTGTAVLVTAAAQNARLENNIFSMTGGRAIEVAADSQRNFASDYNLFHLQGTAELGLWQAVVRPTLAAWRSGTTTDAGSIAADPRFVDAAAGDFHVQSPAGSFHGGSLASIPGPAGLPVAAGGAFVADATRSPAIDRGKEGYSVANEPAPNGGFIEIGAYGNTAQASKSAATYVLVTSPDGGESIPAGRNVTLRWRAENLGAEGVTVALALVRDGSLAVIPVASAAPNTGSYTFFLPADTVQAADYRLRVTRSDVADTVDTSDTAFTVTEPINLYYVNDAVYAAGDFTTAAGDDANDGLDPARPKATISALLAAYDLGPGDVILVDAGTYALGADIQISPDDSGVTIRGYTVPGDTTRRALLDRGNRSDGTSVIRLAGADDVTLERLSLTGGYYGVYAASGADSDRLTIRDSVFFDAAGTGSTYKFVYLESSNDAATITGSTFTVTESGLWCAIDINAAATVTGNTLTSTTGNTGIRTSGGTISGNTVTGGSFGISVASGSSTTISDNDVAGQYVGISTYSTPATISGNRVHDMRRWSDATGISVSEAGVNTPVLVTANDVWNIGGSGIRVAGPYAVVRSNTVSLSGIGIGTQGSGYYAQTAGSFESNRVFANTTGIFVSRDTQVRGNTVYSNSVGIDAEVYFSGTIANNLVYANTNTGIRDVGDYYSYLAYDSHILNNTVYQPVGDAISLAGRHRKVVENNVIRVDAGYAVNVASSALSAVQANNNLFSLSTDPNARIGLWGSTQAATLADWQTTSGQEAASLAADPLFRDISGADDVLGYSTAGSGYDGGRDDNFGLRFGSPAIDAANATLAPATDMFGNARVDDPGTTNVGGSIADIGAIEFLSTSLDTTPPRITATAPARVFSQGTWGITTRIDLTFSEAVDAIDALAARNYRLVEAVNGTFGDADDVVHGLVPTALVTSSGGVTQVRLAIATAGGLPNGQFRLTALGGAANGIRDLAGNMLDGNADGGAGGDFVRTFTIDRALDITPPVVTVSPLATNNTRPTITGTIDDPTATIAVTLAGQTYPVVNPGTGTWSLAGSALVGPIAEGTYDVVVTATDTMGNVGTDASVGELVVDLTPPAVAVGSLITNQTRPTITGTIDDPLAAIAVTVAGRTYAAANSGTGTWSLAGTALDAPLAAGVYAVSVAATDTAGNVGTIDSTTALTIDLTPPIVTVTPQTALTGRPTITGTVNDPAATVMVMVAGSTYTAVNTGDGTWSLAGSALTVELVAGTYDVIATATDLAGNAATDATAGELVIDPNDAEGDTLTSALAVTLGTDTFVHSARIGDGAYGASDVDLFRLSLTAGAKLTAEIFAARLTPSSDLDSYLRLFDSTGQQLTANDDADGLDSRIADYTIPATGTYYVGVSAYGNSSYDPATTTSRGRGRQGPYELRLTAAVPPSNLAPTAVWVYPLYDSLPQSPTSGTLARVAVASVYVDDDGLGTNVFLLSGTDAGDFEIDADGAGGAVLYLKAGVVLDPALQARRSVTVSVRDSSLADAPVFDSLSLAITAGPVRLVFGGVYNDEWTHLPPAFVARPYGSIPLSIVNGPIDRNSLTLDDFVLTCDGVVVPWTDAPSELVGWGGELWIEGLNAITAARGTYQISFTGGATDILGTPLAPTSFTWTNSEPVSRVAGPNGWAIGLEPSNWTSWFDIVKSTVTDDGSVVAVGRFSGTIDFDPRTDVSASLTSTTDGYEDQGFIARYDATGTLVSAWRIDAPITAIAAAAGRITIGGNFTGAAVDLDPRPDVTTTYDAGAGMAFYIVSIDLATGAPLVTNVFADANGGGWWGHIAAIATTADGRIFFSGALEGGSLDLGTGAGGPVTVPATPGGLNDGFVAALGASGAPMWARRIEGTSTDDSYDSSWPRRILVDPASGVLALGLNRSSQLGIIPGDSAPANGEALVIGLDAASGAYRWHSTVATGPFREGEVPMAVTTDGWLHAVAVDYSGALWQSTFVTINPATGATIGAARDLNALLGAPGRANVDNLVPRSDGSVVASGTIWGATNIDSSMYLLNLGPITGSGTPTATAVWFPHSGGVYASGVTADGRFVFNSFINNDSDTFPVGVDGEPRRLITATGFGQAICSIIDPFATVAPPTPILQIIADSTGTAPSTTYGAASAAVSFTVAGSNLTAVVTVTAPAGFELSSDGTTFATTVTFAPTGGAVSSVLYVRLAATTAAGTWSGDVTFASAGAADVQASMPSSTVSPRALTITGVTAASRVYDGTTSVTLDTNAAALSGVISGDTVTLSSLAAAGVLADKDVGTGKPVTTSGFSISGTDSGNYSLWQPTGLVADIMAKALTITGVTAASRVYDGTTSATLGTGAAALSGVISGDTVTLSSGSATAAFATKNVGTGKGVTAMGFALLGASAGNYMLTQPTGLVADITPKALTVTAASRSRVYGANNPSFSVTITGFVAGETQATALTGQAQVTTTATSSSNVGTYALTPGQFTLAASNGNYSFTFVAGTLTVTKASLQVVIDSKTKVAGQADPAFTYGVSGLVNGDTAAGVLTGSPSRTVGETAGNYAIAKGTLALKTGGAASNYNTPTFTNGTLAILAAAKPLFVTGAFAKGSAWADGYLGLTSFTTASGGTRLGYAFGDGSSQLANSKAVTWNNVNQISVRFSEAIASPAATSLSLLAVTGTGVGTQSTITSTAVVLSEGNTVATWTVPNLATGKYTLVLRSNAITAAAGGQLDGEWATSASTFAAGSGNGTAGGDFTFRFNVLMGDVNLNGSVQATDYSSVTGALNASVSASNFRSDITGSGSINGTDALAVSNAIGKNLPTGNYAPTLTTAAGATVDAPFDVTFAEDSAWRNAITGIRVGATAAAATALGAAAWNATVAGRITLDPAQAAQLQTSGNRVLVISATGYADVTLTQALTAGAATKLGIATQPTGPATNGGTLATAPVVRVQDRYGNTVTISTALIVAAVEVGTGDWALGGTLSRNASSGSVTFSSLTATRNSGTVSGARIRFTCGSLTLVVSNAFTVP